jgi:hypothetical protein
MTQRLKTFICTIVGVAFAVTILLAVAGARELRSSGSETGETRDLVNRPDGLVNDPPSDWDRVVFR